MQKFFRIHPRLIFPVLFVSLSLSLFSQNSDSLLLVREVDSLRVVWQKLNDSNQPEAALELMGIARKKMEAKMGTNNPHYASCLHSCGSTLLKMGQFAEAERFYREALEVREHVLGTDNSDYANTLNGLGRVLMEEGKYEESEVFLLKALATRRKVLGEKHEDVVQTLSNLGLLKTRMGQYDKSEEFHLSANKIAMESLGFDNPKYLMCLGNLGILYTDTRRFAEAEAVYLKMIAIQEQKTGKNHPDYALALNNLAVVYWKMEDFKKAEPLYIESKKIRAATLGTKHPYYGWSLNNLGSLYLSMQQFEKSIPFLEEAKAVWEAILGKEHPDMAHVLSNLGMAYDMAGHTEKSNAILKSALDTWVNAIGTQNPYFVKLSEAYANRLLINEQFEESSELIGLSNHAIHEILYNASWYMPEEELEDFVDEFQEFIDLKHGYNLDVPEQSERFTPLSFDNAMFQKGFLLIASKRLRNLAKLSPETEAKYQQLALLRKELSDALATPTAERGDTKNLETDIKALEKDLSMQLKGFDSTAYQAGWRDVQNNLQLGEAAIEFIRFNRSGSFESDSFLYAALLLLPGKPAPEFVPLFEEKELDSLLNVKKRRIEYVQNLYDLAERGVVEVGKPQKTLYELVWQPLEKHLAGVKTIYFSPAGLLHRLNLGAIPVDEETSVSDRFQLVQLGSTRQLAFPKNENVAPGNQTALVFGGIQFDADSAALDMADISSRSISEGQAQPELSFSQTDSTLRGGSWKFLKWTETEAADIQNQLQNSGLQAQLLRGSAAAEEQFKKLGTAQNSPQILHLATHGYFFPDPTDNRQPSADNREEPVFKTSNHPMIRSGLILAGANHAWKTGRPLREGMEDGILTAYEISQMNLSNTELVVLSACETGLGDIRGNEGVFGLQRAFKIAGAKYLLMSLWQVPDKATQELMSAFYQKWIGEKMELRAAFRAAQAELKLKYPAPFYWAGFVLVE